MQRRRLLLLPLVPPLLQPRLPHPHPPATGLLLLRQPARTSEAGRRRGGRGRGDGQTKENSAAASQGTADQTSTPAPTTAAATSAG